MVNIEYIIFDISLYNYSQPSLHPCTLLTHPCMHHPTTHHQSTHPQPFIHPSVHIYLASVIFWCCYGNLNSKFLLSADIVDSSGIEFFYTSVRREHDAGIMNVGHLVQNIMVIPPNAANYTIIGQCSPECTSEVCKCVCVWMCAFK